MTLDIDLSATSYEGSVNILGDLTLNGTATIDHGSSLLFDGTQTLAGTGQVAFGPDAYDIGYGDLIYNSVLIESPSAAVSTLTIGPSLTVGGRSGEIEGTGGNPTQIVNRGAISPTGYITIQDTAFDNQGTVQATGGGFLSIATPPTNLSSGTLTGGTWSVGAGSTLDFSGVNITTDDAAIVLDGSGANFPALAQLTSIGAGGSLELLDGASLTTTSDLDNAGTIELSPGTLTVNGAFTQENTGGLDIGVGGLSAGSQFGQIIAIGQSNLSGTLDISLIGSFAPTPGQSLTILTGNPVSSQFTTVSQAGVSGPVVFQTLYSSDALALSTADRLSVAITPVSPNPRNTTVSSIAVDLSEMAAPGGFDDQALALTDNGGPNLITSAVTVTPMTAGVYVIGGLDGLTAADGNYVLTVDADEITDPYWQLWHRVGLDPLADGYNPADQCRQPAPRDYDVHQLRCLGQRQRPEWNEW